MFYFSNNKYYLCVLSYRPVRPTTTTNCNVIIINYVMLFSCIVAYNKLGRKCHTVDQKSIKIKLISLDISTHDNRMCGGFNKRLSIGLFLIMFCSIHSTHSNNLNAFHRMLNDDVVLVCTPTWIEWSSEKNVTCISKNYYSVLPYRIDHFI